MRLPPASFQPTPSAPLPPLTLATRELLALVALCLGALAVHAFLQAANLGVPETLEFLKHAAAASEQGGRGAGYGKMQTPGGVDGVGAVSRARRGEDLAVMSGKQSEIMGFALVRVMIEGFLCAWIYIVKGRGFGDRGGLLVELLGNQVVFSGAMLDMLFWGYLWTVVREERRVVFKGVEAWRDDEERDE
jgi:hypothetical protein